MTDIRPELFKELTSSGLVGREVRWLLEQFCPTGDPATRSLVERAASRRRAGEPLQYILGHWPFRNLDLDIDERVLIPRPETEQLVSLALGDLTHRDLVTPLIVDLGCGSGAIGLSLLVELEQRGALATLIGVDRSKSALTVARHNAVKHHVTRVSFLESCWFDAVDESLRRRVDLVVANPPYVGESTFEGLDPILRYEPREALVAADARGIEGFADLLTIIQNAPQWLSMSGTLICEHGEDQGTQCRDLAHESGRKPCGREVN